MGEGQRGREAEYDDASIDWCGRRDVDVTVTRVRSDLAALLAHYGLADRAPWRPGPGI